MNLIDLADIHAASAGFEMPIPTFLLQDNSTLKLERPTQVEHRQALAKRAKPVYIAPNSRALTARQQEVLTYIVDSSKDRGFAPTLRDIQKAIGLDGRNLSAAAMHVDALVRKGYITKLPGQSRTIHVVNQAG